jgi:EAL and modified HD-GYP domain-containing signal transduction protein
LEFILAYEDADWNETLRLMLLNKIGRNVVYDAYLEALDWYKKIVNIK